MRQTTDPVRVLHVDDEPGFADMAAAFLERDDGRFQIEVETSASDGLTRLSEAQFDCVISDYDMPGRNGIEFLEAVREDHPDLPFVLFTGKGSEAVASEAISAGVTDYLQKSDGTDQYTVLANRIRNAVERRDAERERDRQLEAIESAREGISILDEDGHYIFVNQRFADLHGYEPQEMTGEHWTLLYRDEDVPEVRDDILPAVEREGYWHGETTSLRANGETVAVDHTLSLTDRGELICTVRDLSDQRERERELREKTARLEALFENSPDMINVHDSEGNLVRPNPRLCEKTGYDVSELTDMKVWDLDRTIGPEEARSLWADMAVGDTRRIQGSYQCRDGSTFPVEVHIRRLRLEGKTRFVATARDVTDRERRERELETLRQRMEFALDATDTLIFEVNLDTHEETYHGVFERLYGLSPDDIATSEEFYERAVHPDDRDRLREFESVDALQDRSGTVGLDYRTNPANGPVKWIYYEAQVLTDDHGQPERLVGSATDITERKERERELKRQNERLDEFASVVSHDLRNPLNVATGRLELLEAECDSEHLPPVQAALERMQALVDDVLTVARQGRAVEDTEQIALEDLVESCWATVATEDATLVVADGVSIAADRSRVGQLLENLFRNAVEHAGNDVTVTVGTLTRGFYIEDDGPGIPDAQRDDVFEPGYSKTDQGTGFGLNIVKEIAEAHGWDVAVTDGETGGARFEITGVEISGE